MSESEDIDRLLDRAAAGDLATLDEIFSRYRKRLLRMVRLRLSRQLQGRLDDADIVQEAYLEAAKRLPESCESTFTVLFVVASAHGGEDH